MKKINIEGMVYMCLTLERKKEIEQKANSFRQEADTEIDVIRLAVSKGFMVMSANFPEGNADGGIIIKKEKGTITKQILVEDNLDSYQQRFIIAHELGHYALHYDQARISEKVTFLHMDTHENKTEAEQEADFFAACVLMPAQHFRELFEDLSSRIGDHKVIINILSQIFRVPIPAVMRRVSEVYLLEAKLNEQR